jgi:hypothetical protein
MSIRLAHRTKVKIGPVLKYRFVPRAAFAGNKVRFPSCRGLLQRAWIGLLFSRQDGTGLVYSSSTDRLLRLQANCRLAPRTCWAARRWLFAAAERSGQGNCRHQRQMIGSGRLANLVQ